MYKLWFSFLLVSCLIQVSCISFFIGGGESYDSRPLTIQSLDLFDQRLNPRIRGASWKGDWIFRRERLDLIDGALKNVKPDIFIVQSLLEKRESPNDSDRNILSISSLEDYEWQYKKISEFDDTFEDKYLAVAAGLPLRIDKKKTLSEKELWEIGDGFLALTVIEFEEQSLLVANVILPANEVMRPAAYKKLGAIIEQRLKLNKICSRRLVIAGYIPEESGSIDYKILMQKFNLKDSSEGYCEVESKCYTATPINEIFMLSLGDQRPKRVDRILVPQSSIVYSSASNIKEPKRNHPYVKQFGIEHLWPSQRFGWVTNSRFARCPVEIAP